MSEEFILDFIPARIRAMGYTHYHLRYRDIVLPAGGKREIEAYNDLYFLIGDPEGLSIDSDYGLYDSTASNGTGTEHTHQHRGLITIFNQESISKKVKFIQVIIVS
ncbi:MAG: hypothetical protein M3Q97_07225 [Bacteroidota bacterium]|nr:hypothetical protein [Bacteroidota bacterium]